MRPSRGMSTVTKVTGLVLSAGQLPLEGVPEKGTRQETSRGGRAMEIFMGPLYIYIYIHIHIYIYVCIYIYIYIHMWYYPHYNVILYNHYNIGIGPGIYQS